MKKFNLLIILVTLFFISVQTASAHVVVRPNEIGVGSRSNFTVSVPTEKDTSTVQVRLLIPEGVESVRPNVKQGWSIELVKSGERDAARVVEVIWSGGSIPAEQRDEFIFSAQVPGRTTTLQWKAYQTYADGSVIAWDRDPKEVEEYTKNNPVSESGHDEKAPNPFSITKVINDLTNSPAPEKK